MRLTLRTMLAYMDGVLSPADAEELRRKIEQNEGAAGIMHRVRDVQCRLRLGAPKVDGRGLGGDANTVAEYLDNTLAADRIPEFERICLESDAHLAEAAACHHILALVLGERAEVDPELRRKLYGLIHAPQQPPEATPPVAAPPVAEPELAAAGKSRRKPSVPDYLRDQPGRRSALKWLIGIAAAVLLAVIAAMAIGPEKLLSQLRGTDGERHVAAANGETTKEAETKETTADKAADGAAIASEPAADVATGADETADTVDVPVTEGNDEGETAAEAAAATSRAEESPELTPPPMDEASETEAAESAPSAPTPDAGPSESTAAPVAAPDEDPAAETETSVAEGSGTDSVPAPPAANEVGRCFLQKDILLRLDVKEGIWKRLAHGDIVHAGDRLLAFPRFSPAVTLTNGVAVEMSGTAQVVVEAPDGDGTPGLRVLYGRMILMPLSDPQSPVRLLIGDQEHVVTFPDTKTVLAVEVRPELVNGSNPEQTPAPRHVEFCLVDGKLGWQGATADSPSELTAPLVWTTDPAAPVAGAETPKWIRDQSKTGESVAAPTIEEMVTADRPVTVSLKEAAKHPRHRELRSLAAKCLALVGEYDDFVAILSDPAQWPAWDGQIEELRASMARSPEDAAKVRAALEEARSSDAGGLYRLLWGYTSEQFSQGGAADELLADLEHPDIDYRVLAHWNLRQLTGMRHPYDARDEDGKLRKDRVELWQKKVAQWLKDKQGA